jgi:CubicO group peptidase (beta-lactamase class C family)
MQLVEQGKLDLDEPVSKHLPELANMNVLVVKKDDDGNETFEEVPAEREITTRDLLRHTSGFTYGFFGDSEVDKRYLKAGVLRTGETIAEMVNKLSKIALKHPPATRWEYSVSTDVLGRLVEVVSGQRFDEYLAKNIFEPLDMTDTFFSVPQEKQDRLAQMYSPDGDKLKPSESIRSRRFVNQTKFFSGGGGLCSTPRDYLRFCQMLLGEGELEGARVLKPETIKTMTTNQLDDSIERREGFDFGLGFAISPEGRYSWGGAAGTRFWIDPENQIIGQFMTQIIPYRDRNFGDQIRELVYASLKE